MSVFYRPLHSDFTVTDFLDLADVGNERDTQIFGELRPDLPGIGRQWFAAADNQVIVFNFFQRLCPRQPLVASVSEPAKAMSLN